MIILLCFKFTRTLVFTICPTVMLSIGDSSIRCLEKNTDVHQQIQTLRPSERLSSGRWPLFRGIHLLQAIAKERIIFSHVRFLFCSIFDYSSTSVTCIKISSLGKKMASQLI